MSDLTVRRIEGIELFRGCRRSQLERVDQLGTSLTVRAGRALCREGKRGSELFVLVDGLAEVQTPGGGLALLRRGAWFGETALIYNTAHRASVTTVVDSMLIVFNRAEFNELCRVAPNVRERLELITQPSIGGDVPASRSWYQPINVAAIKDRLRDAAIAGFARSRITDRNPTGRDRA
jgi:CRP-like cAMP-binding protein